ncbi:MAG: hypothetical protein R2809_07845 [Flavobacteriales bacterium]
MKLGVKPKIESNVVATALLFLLLSFQSFASSICPSDTIIIDGEIITIKKRERKVNVDSLDSQGLKDVIHEKNPIRGYAEFFGGMSIPLYTEKEEMAGFTSVTDFIGIKPRFALNYAFGAKLGVELMDGISVNIGGSYQSFTFTNSTIASSSIAPDDQRTNFENRNGELWQRYVVFIDPGFEERFSLVPAGQDAYKVGFVNLTADFKYNFYKKNVDYNPVFVLGFNQKAYIGPPPSLKHYFVNANGQWAESETKSTDFNKSWTFINIGVGANFNISDQAKAEIIFSYNGLNHKLFESEFASGSFSAACITANYVRYFNYRK